MGLKWQYSKTKHPVLLRIMSLNFFSRANNKSTINKSIFWAHNLYKQSLNCTFIKNTKQNFINQLQNVTKQAYLSYKLTQKHKKSKFYQNSPGLKFVTPSPTLSTIPAPSWPKTTGNAPSGSWPLKVYPSVWQTAVYSTFNLTSWAFGGATSIVSILRSSLGPQATAALHVIT